MNKRALPLLAGLVAAGLAAPASANYSKIITFGDSLSDNGNLFALTGMPPVPYFNGRFSNGPVAVEVMAQTLGLGLTDYAFGGAQTGTGNVEGPALNGTGVAGQIANYGALTGGHADASALFVVWAGPNDFSGAANMLNPSTPFNASTNLLNDIKNLYNLGARDFFVPLMPNLGVTPLALKTDLAMPGFAALASGQSAVYNGLLSTGLASLGSTLSGINIKTFDTAAFQSSQMAVFNSLGKDTTHPCLDSAAHTLCSNPDNYMFWDVIHPTAASHYVLGKAFAAAVPEPQAYELMASGLVLIFLASRRKNSTSRTTKI